MSRQIPVPERFKLYKVVKSNKVINAKESFSLYQQRIILLICAQIKPEDQDFTEYKIPIRDIVGLESGKKISSGYKRVRDAARGLTKSSIDIDYGGRWESYAFITVAKGDIKKDYITVKLSMEMKEFFLNLKDNYTSYLLKNVYAFSKSHYSLRLYELMIQYFPKIRKRKMDIDYLKEMFYIRDKYKHFPSFKRRVLDVAVDEVNEKSDINITYEIVRVHRVPKAIEFSIAPKSGLVPDTESTETPLSDGTDPITIPAEDAEAQPPASVSIALPDWLTEKKLYGMVKQYGEEKVAYCIARIEEKKDVQSKGAYLYKALKEDYYGQEIEAERERKKKQEDADKRRKDKAKQQADKQQLEQRFHEEYARKKNEAIELHDSEDSRFEYMSDIEFESEYKYERRYLQEWTDNTPSEDALKFYGLWLLKRHGKKQDWDLDTFLETNKH
ncbi:hypothetical protein FUAX_54030 (plasmid) [Fulvitalea axinellae]|uniref:Initiator Rep protein WH1 domain-containing protein n=1 Tax=Fulvitalea axinellae TaxID=1182444 RepID=A0AAU9DIK1_9BACT|nr:hypothetical protein FUAX_54030 [Fulvitalea axinellae]